MARYGLNQMMLIGNVGSDKFVQFRTLNAGTQQEQVVGKFSLCTSTPMGGGRTNDVWHQVVVYGPTAKAVQNHIKQGRQLYVQGYWRNRVDIDPTTGLERRFPEVVIGGPDSIIRFLDSEEKAAPAAAPDQSAEDAMAALIPGYKAPVAPRAETATVDTTSAPPADEAARDLPVEHMNIEDHGRTAMQDTATTGKKSKKNEAVNTEAAPV